MHTNSIMIIKCGLKLFYNLSVLFMYLLDFGSRHYVVVVSRFVVSLLLDDWVCQLPVSHDRDWRFNMKVQNGSSYMSANKDHYSIELLR
jgi:hypothetical protein